MASNTFKNYVYSHNNIKRGARGVKDTAGHYYHLKQEAAQDRLIAAWMSEKTKNSKTGKKNGK
jgi:hypothetical protein